DARFPRQRMQRSAGRAQAAGNELRYCGSEVVDDWYAVLAAEGLTLELDAATIADYAASTMGEIASYEYLQEISKRSVTEYQEAFRTSRDSVARNAADAAEKRFQSGLLR